METPRPSTRQERRALERAARRWCARVQQRDDLPEDVRALAPLIAATAVEQGGTFTEADVLRTLGIPEEA
ncbi:hypothetical protein [Sinomonas soli]